MYTTLSCGVKCHDSVSLPRAFALVRHSETLVHASVQAQLMTLLHAYSNKQTNTDWKDGSVLPKDRSSVPSTQVRQFITASNSSSRGFHTLLKPLGALVHIWHAYTHIYIYVKCILKTEQ